LENISHPYVIGRFGLKWLPMHNTPRTRPGICRC